jgi:hypothetical protein
VTADRLNVFAAHRHQVGLDINVASLQAAIMSGDTSGTHPALLNAIYLWACFFSRPGPLATRESYFVQATTDALNEALKHGAYLLDAVRASCLLALYFFCLGRITDGAYHQSAAARLVLSWELFRAPAINQPITGCFSLGPPRTVLEAGTRISTFWQVRGISPVRHGGRC